LTWSSISTVGSGSTTATFDFESIHGSTLITQEDGDGATVEFRSVFTLLLDGNAVNFVEVEYVLTVDFSEDFSTENLVVRYCSHRKKWRYLLLWNVRE
jgi:hypothetical protein